MQKQPIDIEALLQWAIARSGRLPWRLDDERELSMNKGLTARLRRRPKVGWETASVCAGLTIRSGRLLAPGKLVPGPDADIVLEAIQRLPDPAVAATVIYCARSRIRPNWMPGVDPKQVQVLVRCKKKHRRVRAQTIWEPCSPAAVRAAREGYAQWHAALSTLARELDGHLSGWEISGFAAPAEPWTEKSATLEKIS